MAAPIATIDLDLILEHTRELWEEMRGQQIFVTGGTGFFGCWLVESFLHINRRLGLGARMTVLTRDPGGFADRCPHLQADAALTLLAGDVREFDFPDGEFRYVIHAATESSAKQFADSPLEMLQTILRGTERTLQFAAGHGTRKFLFPSSGAVYGEQPADIAHLTESYAGAPDPLDPRSVYAEGKRAAERMCGLYAARFGMECKIARCFAFVGPHLPLEAHFAIGNFVRDAMRGDAIRIGGDGTPRRSYLYAADLAIWLWTMLFRARSMEAYNVGSDESVSILELAQIVSEALGLPPRVEVAKSAIAGAPVKQYVPGVAKAMEQLGLRRHVSLQDAIRRTAAWHGYHRPALGL